MDEIQKTLCKAGRKDLAQKYYEKVASTKTTIDKVKTKDGNLEIEIIEDSVMQSGDTGHVLNFKQKKFVPVSIAKSNPDPVSEKRATKIAKDIINILNRAG